MLLIAVEVLLILLIVVKVLLIFSSPVRSTEELMSSPVRRRWRPMLTFAFRSNVDKLLGSG
jgi:hypothetical protein